MKLIAKGFLIGIGKILPGISGAMIAITIGEYENIIENIATIKNDTIKKMKYLSKISIGIIISIILMSKVVVKCLNKYYLATILLFILIILIGIKDTIKKIKYNKKDFLITIILILLFILIINNFKKSKTVIIQYSILQFIKIICIGIIDAISSIVPGLSGTALLMMLGYYNVIINTFSNILQISQIKTNIFIMSSFMIGFIIGTLFISKIINMVRKKCPNILNIIICFLMIYSIYEIIINLL